MSRGGPVARDPPKPKGVGAGFDREKKWCGRYARFLLGGPSSPWAGRFFGMNMLDDCFGRLTGRVNRGGFWVGLGPPPAEDSPGIGARPDPIPWATGAAGSEA